MAKGNINQLGLANEPIETPDFGEIPEQGSFAPPIPPGTYRFQLPKDLTTCWDKFDSQRGERINAIFDQDAPLLIVQSPGKTHDNEPFTSRLSNLERPRGKEKILVSDLAYLLKALGHKVVPRNNSEWAKAVQQYKGREFTADVEWSWYCNDKRDIYMLDAQGASQQVEGKQGCGARYYQNDVAKVNGAYPERITCGGENCGASVRAFPNLTRIRA